MRRSLRRAPRVRPAPRGRRGSGGDPRRGTPRSGRGPRVRARRPAAPEDQGRPPLPAGRHLRPDPGLRPRHGLRPGVLGSRRFRRRRDRRPARDPVRLVGAHPRSDLQHPHRRTRPPRRRRLRGPLPRRHRLPRRRRDHLGRRRRPRLAPTPGPRRRGRGRHRPPRPRRPRREPLPRPRGTPLLPALHRRPRALDPPRLRRHRRPDPALARHRPPPADRRRPPRAVRGPRRPPGVQLPRHREPAPPHPRPRRALPLLQRRHLPRPPAAPAELLPLLRTAQGLPRPAGRGPRRPER